MAVACELHGGAIRVTVHETVATEQRPMIEYSVARQQGQTEPGCQVLRPYCPVRCARRLDTHHHRLKGRLMKAAVVREFHQPVVLEDRPIPEPGFGQVLVKIEASGLCHTDIHAANGDWPV